MTGRANTPPLKKSTVSGCRSPGRHVSSASAKGALDVGERPDFSRTNVPRNRRCAPVQGESGLGSDRGGGRVQSRGAGREIEQDRKSTRLNSSHLGISYAVF